MLTVSFFDINRVNIKPSFFDIDINRVDIQPSFFDIVLLVINSLVS